MHLCMLNYWEIGMRLLSLHITIYSTCNEKALKGFRFLSDAHQYFMPAFNHFDPNLKFKAA